MLSADVRPSSVADWRRASAITYAVRSVVDGVVLPMTELSGFRGYPVVQWDNAALAERLRTSVGPMLDRPTLSLWERWPAHVNTGPPPSPLRIVGFASSATWRHAIRAARELRGFGATAVVCDRRPSQFRLAEADFGAVFVVTLGGEVLVHGSAGSIDAPRMVATRYWEERLFAHALAVGATTPKPGQA